MDFLCDYIFFYLKVKYMSKYFREEEEKRLDQGKHEVHLYKKEQIKKQRKVDNSTAIKTTC